MKYLSTIAVVCLTLWLLVLLPQTVTVSAHEHEDFTDWAVGFSYVRFLGPPVFVYKDVSYVGIKDPVKGYPTIDMATGDILIAKYSFMYLGGPLGNVVTRGDLFWITRLGLDFGTLGRYINGTWIGGASFALIPGQTYDAEIVMRALQPTLRHLHVGVSVKDVGNIPAAPYELPTPLLYGIWTSATGAVVEPLAGINVQPFGDLKLLEVWPWAFQGVVAQILIGAIFIAVMLMYRRRELKQAAGGS